ncbi:MAG: outer membrane protein [Legionellales bacterium]
MQLKTQWFALTSCLLGTAVATAGGMGSLDQGFRPLASVYGGLALVTVNAGSAHTFVGSDDNLFNYQGQSNSDATVLAGAFLGAEHQLPHPGLFVQTGLEYSYFGNGSTKGANSVGIEPDTSTYYHYSWRVQTQQVLAVAKLFTTSKLPILSQNDLYPYLSLGLGAAFNKAKQFSASPEGSGSFNVTPAFNSNSTSAFSYSLGLGVDTNIDPHLRVGLGYRFSSFGKAALGDGQVVFNQYKFPVPFSLDAHHAYANQIIAQLSYLA